MKKRLLAGAMACILMLGATTFAEVDLSGMNNAELQQLYTNVLSALSASENAASFSVDGGIYTAGVDFPVGKYCIEALEGSFANYDIYDADGHLVLGGVIDTDGDKKIGNIEMLEGYVFKSDRGAHFAPPAGIHFD